MLTKEVTMPTEREHVVLITGAAQRIGRSIAEHLHSLGYRLIIHYHRSETAAQNLANALNTTRTQSALALKADLNSLDDIEGLAKAALQQWGRIDTLVNNASSFIPSSLQESSQTLEQHWDSLMNSNLKGPFFLSHALSPALKIQQGNIINIIDIHGERPLKDYPIYSMAKAGLVMMTKALAKELAPHIRVNGVSPGAILWPDHLDPEFDETQKQTILKKIPLARSGSPQDIAGTVAFLMTESGYINGQIIAVDGGRLLNT